VRRFDKIIARIMNRQKENVQRKLKKRRALAVLGVLGAVVLSGCASGKNAPDGAAKSNLPTVAFLQITSSVTLEATREGYLRGLQENGFKDGENFHFDHKSAEGDIGTAQLMAREFVGRNVEVFGVSSSPALQTAIKATKEIPIVFCGVADPASAGAIKNGKPLENVTGISNPDPVEKTLALIKEIMPQIKTVGTLYDPSEPFSPLFRGRSQAAAKKLGLEWIEISVNNTNDITTGVQALKARGAQAIMQIPSNVADAGIAGEIKAAGAANIPFFSTHPTHIPAGALACLGWDYEQAGYEAGVYAAKVLKGAKPAELPIKSVQKEDLVINLPVANKFGVKIPKAVLARAARVQK
jgi:putative ABC transport system substrate-binding protein